MAHERDSVIDEVVAAAGGMASVAANLSVTYQAIWQWRRIPVRHVLALEEMTGIPRERMRPDIYGKPRPPHAMMGVAALA